jgi:3-dehydroquinate dehydratase-2
MKKAPSVLVLHGPNLNKLGTREPKVYGKTTLHELEASCVSMAKKLGLAADCRQSNLEGELVTWIQEARKKHDGIVINAGGYSHSSVAILDALTLSELPIIEVHISNIYAREPFRHQSLISKVAKGVICGLGLDGYTYALEAMAKLVGLQKANKRSKAKR